MQWISAHFRFYEELNDFLPENKKKVAFAYQFQANQNIRQVISMIGVPHTEIDLLLVNGRSVGFDYILKNNDHVSIYPVFESLDISTLNKLRPKPLRDTKFIADAHLG